MLIDVILACAPVVAALPAVFTLLTSHTSVASKAQVEKRLYRTLLLAEKLPPTAAFAPQIAKDIDRQTLHVAYVAQYPQRAREIVHLVLIGVGALALGVGYYVLLADDTAFLTLLIVLAGFAVTVLWLERALLNFNVNDGFARELFARFGAPDGLVRPRTELIAKAPALTVDAALQRAADVRDANHESEMTSIQAVNAALAQAHSHFDWRLETARLAHHIAQIDYRTEATVALRWSSARGAIAYDWLLRHVVGPFFTWRLTFLDSCERLRTTKAQRTGDVFATAWLPTHYRNERERVADQWTYLHEARDPLLRWSGNGRHTPAPIADDGYRVEPVS